MIFGTDGIRARVGKAPLDQKTIETLSYVLSDWLEPGDRVVLGADTRASCEQIRAWICSSLGPYHVDDLGVVPTPVVAYEAMARGASLGIMITASHNPAHDNGLKFFDREGLKLNYEIAGMWSQLVEASDGPPRPNPAKRKTCEAEHYLSFIEKHFKSEDFKGLKVGFDLAHGAGCGLVPDLLTRLGIDAVFMGDQPDGGNINDGVGALHPSKLCETVAARSLDVGFALDGDGDRLIVTTDHEIPGDVTLYAMYRNLLSEGRHVDAVVGTIMCGMGLERCLAEQGVTLHRTAVGDQHVLAKMVAGNHLLGGEPSGHLIQADLFPAGDGFLAALRLARALARNKQLLVEAEAAVPRYPTIERAYTVRWKPPLSECVALGKAVSALAEGLGETGRYIIRYSGTEPKLRLYVEAPELEPHAEAVAAVEDAIAGELT